MIHQGFYLNDPLLVLFYFLVGLIVETREERVGERIDTGG